jgi:hypothetical protein
MAGEYTELAQQWVRPEKEEMDRMEEDKRLQLAREKEQVFQNALQMARLMAERRNEDRPQLDEDVRRVVRVQDNGGANFVVNGPQAPVLQPQVVNPDQGQQPQQPVNQLPPQPPVNVLPLQV